MPHAGVHRAFDLSAWAYFLDFVLVPIAAIALLWFAGSQGLALLELGGGAALGVLAWSLAEYWIHRLVFHGATPFEAMHQQHHALPRDWIGIAPWGTFAGFAVIWLLAAIVVGAAPGAAITAGVMAGYLFYCVIHVSMHHDRARGFGRYGAMMRRLHQAHHRGGRGNFGVSSPIWDLVFRTHR